MRNLPFVAIGPLPLGLFGGLLPLGKFVSDDFKGSSFITIPEPLPNGRASIYLKMQ